MIDKAALSWSYVWLGYCLVPLGTRILASFSVVKDLERFALCQRLLFCSSDYFLVSNDYGRKIGWDQKYHKKKVFLSSIGLFCSFVCSFYGL